MTSSWIFRALSWSLLAELRTTWCSPVWGFVAQAARTSAAAQATACLRSIARLPWAFAAFGLGRASGISFKQAHGARRAYSYDRALRQEVPPSLAAGTVPGGGASLGRVPL